MARCQSEQVDGIPLNNTVIAVDIERSDPYFRFQRHMKEIPCQYIFKSFGLQKVAFSSSLRGAKKKDPLMCVFSLASWCLKNIIASSGKGYGAGSLASEVGKRHV